MAILPTRFDGGYVPDYATVPAKNLTEQLSNLQPDAVVFNGFGVARSPIRWSLSEDGSIEYPNWSVGSLMAALPF